MVSSTRVPPTEITGVYGALLKTMSRKMLGQVPEGAGVMWHYPALLKDMMAFGRKSESWNRLDPNLASFATMAAVGAVGCSFCLDLITSCRTTAGSTRRRRGRCRAGVSPPPSLHWSGGSWSTPRRCARPR